MPELSMFISAMVSLTLLKVLNQQNTVQDAFL